MEKPKQINIGTENHPLNVFRADAINAYLSSIADVERIKDSLMKSQYLWLENKTKHSNIMDHYSEAIHDHIKGNK